MSPKTSEKANPKKGAEDTEPIETSDELFDRIGGMWLRFERYRGDILGVVAIVIALLSFWGLMGWTSGSFISPWGEFFKRWFGYAAYIISSLFAVIGILVLRRSPERNGKLKLGTVWAVEGGLFVIMALLAIVRGLSLERAEQGLDGGVIGWGLGHLFQMILPMPWAVIVLILLLIYFTIAASGFGTWLRIQFEKWLFQADNDEILGELPVPGSVTVGSHGGSQAAGNPPASGELNEIPVVAIAREENLPPLSLLIQEGKNAIDEDRILLIARKIEKTLLEFGIPSRVIGYRVGPTVTQFAVEPGYIERAGGEGEVVRQKVRVSQISQLSRDLALALAADRLRIEAPVPGHSYVGIEVPNAATALVYLRSIIEAKEFAKLGSPLAIALGRDVSGQPVVADLGRMPHLLVAGTTGSGKSVCLASIITCLVMNNSPASLRLVVLDPKMVELIRFSGLPHILGKVETEIERMLAVLRWALAEMDQRYRLLEAARVRDLEAYNRRLEKRKQKPLPRIVILIDELADLMMSAMDETEHRLVRLAQMARATGIHLVIATQRPSVDVVTGLIKANFPARIAFTVASSVDSRVILDVNGAESLLGKGDMLFLNPESGTPQRTQGVLLKDAEIDRVIAFWQQHQIEPPELPPWEDLVKTEDEEVDDLIDQAIALVKKSHRASASLLQRRLRIGFPRAARLLDELEKMGVVGPSQGGGKDREVLVEDDEEDESEYHLDEPTT
jgi:S-DNA-T family DNA segregation ATPase FtsK/SpoIIIE